MIEINEQTTTKVKYLNFIIIFSLFSYVFRPGHVTKLSNPKKKGVKFVKTVVESVRDKIRKGNYHSVTIKRGNEIICILRPPRKALKKNPNAAIAEFPVDYFDISWLPVKSAEITRKGGIIIYV